MILLLLLLLLMTGAVDVVAEVACYHCYGNSSEQGQFCSINHLCLGQSCVFSVLSSGEWASGCSSEMTSTTFDCTASDSGSELSCKCMSDLCNNFKVANETVGRFLGQEGPFKDTTLMLPRLLVNCIECGNVSIGGRRALSIPCTEEQICQGDFCVTKRGLNPYSYCDTTWTGTNEARCFKNPDEEEQCVCAQDMCNLSLYPVVSSGTASKEEKCKKGMVFSPNTHATSMAEKLGEIIRNGFSATSKANEKFSNGIDTHLCP
ncbi:hypothetical protein Angca_001935 [Angiostrongylus cantonensis]|nr:hypothetical protein Angca_001935 [Angiostrongylus cantonensis]